LDERGEQWHEADADGHLVRIGYPPDSRTRRNPGVPRREYRYGIFGQAGLIVAA
jgi:hypothetical protein